VFLRDGHPVLLPELADLHLRGLDHAGLQLVDAGAATEALVEDDSHRLAAVADQLCVHEVLAKPVDMVSHRTTIDHDRTLTLVAGPGKGDATRNPIVTQR
jgi:hypothetical protein